MSNNILSNRNRFQNRTVLVIDQENKQLVNSTLKRAKGLIKCGLATWIEKDEKIQLLYTVKSPKNRIGLIGNLYNKQKGKCNCCHCILPVQSLELHHKYIPKFIKRIDKGWNTELLCHDCHLNKHKNYKLSFLYISILLKKNYSRYKLIYKNNIRRIFNLLK